MIIRFSKSCCNLHFVGNFLPRENHLDSCFEQLQFTSFPCWRCTSVQQYYVWSLPWCYSTSAAEQNTWGNNDEEPNAKENCAPFYNVFLWKHTSRQLCGQLLRIVFLFFNRKVSRLPLVTLAWNIGPTNLKKSYSCMNSYKWDTVWCWWGPLVEGRQLSEQYYRKLYRRCSLHYRLLLLLKM